MTPLHCLRFACVILVSTIAAQETPPRYADRLAHVPRPLPDRIVLTWAADPATTQAVTWRTDTSITRAVAEIAMANESGYQLRPRSVAARTGKFVSDLNEANYHSAHFTELTPDTLYAYRVGDGMNWSEWFHFRTASREAKPFTFVYFGDAQNDVKTHWSRVFREAFRDAPRAAFTLHAGDLINRANEDALWGEWHGAPAWVNATVPVIATPGNHEYYRDGAGPETDRRWTTKSGEVVAVTTAIEAEKDPEKKPVVSRMTARTGDGRVGVLHMDRDRKVVRVDDGVTRISGYAAAELAGARTDRGPLKDRQAEPGIPRVSRHWRPQFTFPDTGVPAGLEETCYYVDYQGARIISLNSLEQTAAQATWLRGVLERNPQRWTIITFHHPIFSPANDRDNPTLRAAWKPLFDEFKVDLVLTGHDHTYARTGDRSDRPSTNAPRGYDQAYNPAIGTVYVVSVSGPKMYDVTADAFVRTAEDTQLYQVITVTGDEIHYEARTAVGRLYDAFMLKKRAGQPNELRETLPPIRRRASP
jgi:3',5'-cyclic AMP phosphodiesterase CpdA